MPSQIASVRNGESTAPSAGMGRIGQPAIAGKLGGIIARGLDRFQCHVATALNAPLVVLFAGWRRPDGQ